MSKFVIETLVTDDWEQLEREGAGVDNPEGDIVRYNTFTEADQELEDHFAAMRVASMDYDRADYRVREVLEPQTEQDLDFIAQAAADFADLIEADQEDNIDQDEDSLADVVKIRAALERLGR